MTTRVGSTSASRRSLRFILAAVIALALAWCFGPRLASPPLYDGLAYPDQPYRFVQAPTGYRHTPAPTGATLSATVGSKGDAYNGASTEVGPQVQIVVSRSSFVGPAGTAATLSVTPAAPSSQPGDGDVWGNVYHVAVNGTGVTLKDGGEDVITLRTPTEPPPGPTLEYNDGSGWKALTTQQAGNDIYSAVMRGPGDYAMVAPKGEARVSAAAMSPAAGGSSAPASAAVRVPAHKAGDSVFVAVCIIAAALVILLVGVVAIRISRSGGRARSRHSL